MERGCKLYEGAKTINSICGENVVIGENSYIQNSVLGNVVQINRRNMIVDCHISDYTYTGANTILKTADVGKFCSISWNVSVTGNQHNYHMLSSHPFSRLSSFGFFDKKKEEGLDTERVVIGNDVWIGMNACILPGVKIGTGAIIGGGGVVTRDVPPYAIAVGNPARVIKYRFPEDIIDSLLEIQWWNWTSETIRENLFLFENELDSEKVKDLFEIAKRERIKNE